jgi:hypothetical protein
VESHDGMRPDFSGVSLCDDDRASSQGAMESSKCQRDGESDEYSPMTRRGKHLAGRELDGRPWDEFPESFERRASVRPRSPDALRASSKVVGSQRPLVEISI